MVEGNNGAGSGWYFSKWETFGGIFLKIGSFNGMDPILPIIIVVHLALARFVMCTHSLVDGFDLGVLLIKKG